MAFQSGRHALLRRLGGVALALTLGFHPLLARAYAEEVGRHAVLVVDANTGRVLYERAADAPRYPASLVKLMTLYLVFEQIEQGRLTFASKVRFSANAVGQAPSKLDVEEGTEIDLIDAIKALITKSANDVAVALAERVAGSEERFVELMNRKARELGMTATVFRNASGLPDAEQVTTARDMIALALRIQAQFPKYYPLFSTRTFSWGGDTFRNHNTLLFSYRGLDGMKTGYTRASGFNLVASVRRGKKHVVAAYFGGYTAALRNAAVRARLDAGLAKASDHKTRRPVTPAVAQAEAPPSTTVRTAAAAVVPRTPRPAQRTAPAATAAGEGVPAGIQVMRVRPVLARAPEPAHESAADSALAAPVAGEEPAETDAAPATSPEIAAPRRVAPAPGRVPAGPFQVQIGAFQTQDEAERRLAWARERAGTLLAAHTPHMSQVRLGDKVFFRARYGGFGAKSAAAGLCTALKRLDIDCLVMKAE
jgi:D-alanyl-D-alanine carboxypeptidase